jgi:Tol biopolymer transport system component
LSLDRSCGYDQGVTRRLKSLTALAVVAGCLVAPATSQATLVFTRNPFKPTVFRANDNGSGAHRVGSGTNPHVSPDGQTIVYFGGSNGSKPAELMIAAASGGAPRRLALNWQDPFVFAWSPDSTTIAVLLGKEFGHQRLTTIDLATGAQRMIASGYFSGVSFAPEGGELVYSRAPKEDFPPKSDIYRASLTSGKKPVRLTHDHVSGSPLWGPNGKIVFVKFLGQKQRQFGPKNELFLMSPSGARVKQLTHTKVDPLLSGLNPTAWSANGKHLLAEFGGQDTTYAVTVNPKTGAERALTKQREIGFVGTAISKDGRFVLGNLGGFEPASNRKVLSIPYAGGKPKVLANDAAEADWSR